MIDLINQQVGHTFTEKFENMVTRCMWELLVQEDRLEKVREQITQERDRLFRLQKASKQLRLLEKDIENAKFYFGIVGRRAKAIADAAEET